MDNAHQMLAQQIAGLTDMIRKLREEERVMIKSVGIQEEIEKLREENLGFEDKLADMKEEVLELTGQRNEALREGLGKMMAAMDAFLPVGKSYVDIDEGGTVYLGLEIDGKRIPHDALSGGQQVIFKAALSNAMLKGADDKIIIMEAAEMDGENLGKALAQIAEENPDAQLIVNSWHKPENTTGWEVVEL